MVQNQYYKSVHDVSGLLQPGSLNQLFTLIYKFPIRSTLNFYLVKKMPYILALKISYNLFKVLINNEVKMYIEGDNHQTVEYDLIGDIYFILNNKLLNFS